MSHHYHEEDDDRTGHHTQQERRDEQTRPFTLPMAGGTGLHITQDANDQVHHPKHYGGGDNPHEVIKCLRAHKMDRNAYLWNACKYILRAGLKHADKTIEDLEKARFYLDYEISRLKAGTP